MISSAKGSTLYVKLTSTMSLLIGLSLVFLIVTSLSVYTIPLILSATILFFSKRLIVSFLSALHLMGVILDPIRLSITFTTLFVLRIAFKTLYYPKRGVQTAFVLILIRCVIVFITDNLLLLFFFFERRLLPISLIILLGGTYPDRSKGVILLIGYTLFFRLPFILVLLSIFVTRGS